jgi:hypothetical protein
MLLLMSAGIILRRRPLHSRLLRQLILLAQHPPQPMTASKAESWPLRPRLLPSRLQKLLL